MKKRTRAFALRCIKLASSFSRGPVRDVVGRQLIKAGTSVAANYHAACAGRSHADFLNKLGIVEEEADESGFWIDFSVDAGKVQAGPRWATAGGRAGDRGDCGRIREDG